MFWFAFTPSYKGSNNSSCELGPPFYELSQTVDDGGNDCIISSKERVSVTSSSLQFFDTPFTRYYS